MFYFQWLPEVKHHCPLTPFMLVGTKTDLRVSADGYKNCITSNRGLVFSKDIGAKRYVECSAKTQKGVPAVFEEAVRVAMKPPPRRRRVLCSVL